MTDTREGLPRDQYAARSGVNIGARGLGSAELRTTTGRDDTIRRSEYGKTQITETPGGHIIELNDTLGSERIMIRHATGSGIEIKPDGSILISGTSITYDISGPSKMTVKGNMDFDISGKMNMSVGGDMVMNVGGNLLSTIAGTNSEKIEGSKYSAIGGSSRSRIAGEMTMLTAGNRVETNLGGYTNSTKGNLKLLGDGNGGIYVSGDLGMTAQGRAFLSSPIVGITGKQLEVVGNTGTIGGEMMTTYSYNSFVGASLHAAASVEAPAIHTDYVTSTLLVGDLQGNVDGKAKTAALADKATGADTAGAIGSTGTATDPVIGTGTDTLADTAGTAKPTSGNVTARQGTSKNGVRSVQVDPGGYIAASINRGRDNS